MIRWLADDLYRGQEAETHNGFHETDPCVFPHEFEPAFEQMVGESLSTREALLLWRRVKHMTYDPSGCRTCYWIRAEAAKILLRAVRRRKHETSADEGKGLARQHHAGRVADSSEGHRALGA